MPMIPAMDPLLLEANSGVMATRLRGVQAAEKRLAREVSTIGSISDPSLSHENLWDAIYSILNHCAAISRMFWQPYQRTDSATERKAKRDRAEQLRLWLAVSDNSLLNEDGRDPRNTIEHWGENCADWYQQMAGRQVFDSIVTASPRPGNEFHLRSYNYITEVVSYGGATVELRPLLTEVEDLYNRLSLALGALGNPPTYTQKEPFV